MSYSEKQRQYNDKYDAENMIAYTVKYQRSIYDAVEKAMEKLEWTGINGQLRVRCSIQYYVWLCE